MASITKLELRNRIAGKINRPASELKSTIDTVFDEILTILSEGGRIEIRGFGAFQCKTRKKRLGRNPRTGDAVSIPSYTAPAFKFSKEAQRIFDAKIDKKKAAKVPEKKSNTTSRTVPALTASAEKKSAVATAEQFSPFA